MSSKIWIIIILAILISFNFWAYLHYNYEPRQTNYVNFDDEVFIPCEKIDQKVICYLPNGENLTIKREWNITK